MARRPRPGRGPRLAGVDLAIPAPMLASVGRPLRPTGWAGELKWDGARLLSRCAPDGAVTLATRILRQTTSSFPEIAAALARAAAGRGLVLDGELVAPHPATGHPVFARLQRRLHLTRPTERQLADVPLQYIVFDVLADGEPIRAWPYAERRALLDGLGLDDGDRVRVPPMWPLEEVGVDRLLAAAADVGLEGVVAKRLDSYPEYRRRGSRQVQPNGGRRVVAGTMSPGEFIELQGAL